MYTIGVIGVGCVGGALCKYIEQDTNCKVIKYDPPQGMHDDLSCADAIFICVPAPTLDDRYLDLFIIRSTLAMLDRARCRVPIFIKSTLLPGTTDVFAACHEDLTLCYTPEFLVARQAYDDIKKQSILIGLPNELLDTISLTKSLESYNDTSISHIIQALFPNHDKTLMTRTEAEIAKYTHNCFGAVKVNYCNIIYQLCQKLGCNYKTIVGSIAEFNLLEKHTDVPGPDGQRGYGGACFPKDIKSFIGFLDEKGIQSGAISGTESDNCYYRHCTK